MNSGIPYTIAQISVSACRPSVNCQSQAFNVIITPGSSAVAPHFGLLGPCYAVISIRATIAIPMETGKKGYQNSKTPEHDDLG